MAGSGFHRRGSRWVNEGLFGAHEHGCDFFEDDDGVEEFLSGDGGEMDGLFADLLDLARDLFTRGEAQLDLLASLPVEDSLDGVGGLEIDFALGKTGGEKRRESESGEEVFHRSRSVPAAGLLEQPGAGEKKKPDRRNILQSDGRASLGRGGEPPTALLVREDGAGALVARARVFGGALAHLGVGVSCSPGWCRTRCSSRRRRRG